MGVSEEGFYVVLSQWDYSNFSFNFLLISRVSLKYISFPAVPDKGAYDIVLIDISKLTTALI